MAIEIEVTGEPPAEKAYEWRAIMDVDTNETSEVVEPKLSFMLGVTELPALNSEQMINTIESYEQIEGDVDVQITSDSTCQGTISFGHHKVRWIGIDTVISKETYKNALNESLMEDLLKGVFCDHKAQVTLLYIGDEDDLIEQYIAMYKVVDCFSNVFCGLFNASAKVLNSATTPVTMRDSLLEMRERIPELTLTNVATREKADNEGIWYVSRGNNVFGLPEFAYLGQSDQFQTVIAFFQVLLRKSLKSGKELVQDSVIDFCGCSFDLKEVYECEEFIRNGSDCPVYVLEPQEEGGDDRAFKKYREKSGTRPKMRQVHVEKPSVRRKVIKGIILFFAGIFLLGAYMDFRSRYRGRTNPIIKLIVGVAVLTGGIRFKKTKTVNAVSYD